MLKLRAKRNQSGFTLVELLIVVGVISILSAIVAPTWLRFLAKQQTINGRGDVRLRIQQAQLKAQQQNRRWQFSARENGNRAEIATHPADVSPSAATWTPIHKSVQLDVAETTVLRSADSVYYVRFDEKGNIRGSSLGRVSVSSKQFSDIKRCVFISTLLGATRVAEEQQVPDAGGRFCY